MRRNPPGRRWKRGPRRGQPIPNPLSCCNTAVCHSFVDFKSTGCSFCVIRHYLVCDLLIFNEFYSAPNHISQSHLMAGMSMARPPLTAARPLARSCHRFLIVLFLLDLSLSLSLYAVAARNPRYSTNRPSGSLGAPREKERERETDRASEATNAAGRGRLLAMPWRMEAA